MHGRRSLLRCAGAAACIALLAACSGGTPALPPARGAQALQDVSFTMHWPSRRDLAHLRRPLYISPSTLSVVIEVNSDPTLTVKADNPSTAGSTATSTVNVAAPVGSDTFYFTLWDGTGGTGNELGQAQVTQTVVAGKVNTIGATVNGVLAKIGISPDAGQPFLEVGTNSGGTPAFTMVGDVPATFAISPLDADGNVIVAPGAVPSISLAGSDPSLAVAQTSGNHYTVQVVAPPSPGVHPSLVASGSDGNGFTATTHVPLVVSPAIFVASANGTSGLVQILDGSGTPVPLSGAFAGLQHPNGIAYDAADRRVFVTDTAGGGTVFAFTEDGKAAGIAPIGFSGATAIAYDPQNGQIYVTAQAQNTVGVFTVQGAAVTASGFAGLNAPNGIALSGSNLCVTSATAGQNPACFTASGAAAPPTVWQSSTIASTAVAYDPVRNALWIAGNASGSPSLTGYDASNGYSQYAYTSGLTSPAGVAFNPMLQEVAVLDGGSANILEFQDTWPYLQDTASTIPLPAGTGTPAAFTLTY
ncbi:MAG TPA: hypothetical protein VJP85_05995 [Candidatus Baltobacteraceae bacterium]|nr:hypothetical protein [Candidatus Baltobacteraceae bacterium]